jgi:hypothetical protein
VGSNPTAALFLVALLTGLRFGGEQIKEAIMNKKHRKCAAKRNGRLAFIPFIETIWAIGASVAAAMVISTPTH